MWEGRRKPSFERAADSPRVRSKAKLFATSFVLQMTLTRGDQGRGGPPYSLCRLPSQLKEGTNMGQLVKNGTYIRLHTITLLDCHCAGRPFGEYRPSSAALGLQLFHLNYSSNMQAHTHTAHESGHLEECV